MISEIIGYILISIGLLFNFFGVLGLVRLPDVYNRLQAATKCVTFGTAGILAGVFVMKGYGVMGLKPIICIIFILLTAPVSAHVISRAAHRAKIKLTDETIIDKYEEDKELRK
ncbi:MAG: monovalent cation/H(+) antiporter subunit G [Candidatus Cloacimonetes bacterium]|nr:monovalent cation/H(+) antiporter subunit G [Candidatus Cloacimonadota bacterium]